LHIEIRYWSENDVFLEWRTMRCQRHWSVHTLCEVQISHSTSQTSMNFCSALWFWYQCWGFLVFTARERACYTLPSTPHTLHSSTSYYNKKVNKNFKLQNPIHNYPNLNGFKKFIFLDFKFNIFNRIW